MKTTSKDLPDDLAFQAMMPIFGEGRFVGLTGLVPRDRQGYSEKDHAVWVVNPFQVDGWVFDLDNPTPIRFVDFYLDHKKGDELLSSFLDRITVLVRLPDTQINFKIDPKEYVVRVSLHKSGQVGMYPGGTLEPYTGLRMTRTPEVTKKNEGRLREEPTIQEELAQVFPGAEDIIPSPEGATGERMDLLRQAMGEMIDDDDLLPRRDKGQIPKAALKIGNGLNSLIIDTNGIRTHTEHPDDPGFAFDPRRTVLRHGEYCVTSGSYDHFQFALGTQIFNPLAQYLASSVTDPIRAIVPGVAASYLNSMIGPTIQAVLQLGYRYVGKHARIAAEFGVRITTD